MSSKALNHDAVVAAVGALDDERISAIIATGAGLEELLEARAWADQESDVMGAVRKRLSGRVAAVYDILTADDEAWEEGVR